MSQADIQTATLSNGNSLKVHTQLFINNKFVPGNGPLIETINPVNEEVICKVHSANEKDVDAAVEAANVAFKNVWSKLPAAQRGRYLNILADLMERDKDELATLEALDNGKSFVVARDVDITDAIGCFRYFAGWADKIHGHTIETTYDKMCYTRHEPIGTVAAITPWNYSVMMPAWKLAPALAAGNTIILKTSEVTPLAMLKVAELIVEAGFPAGVVNIITGYGHTAGAHLTGHHGVHKMAFTGSTETGRRVMDGSAKSNIKKVQLELGGKSAQLVMKDADLQNAAVQSCGGIFNNHGQSCNAGSRILVHEDVHDKFLELFIAEAKKIKVGDPFDPEVTQGPQINKAQFEKILSYIDIGKNEGAKLVHGGRRLGNKGYFIEPTVFTGCNNNMRVMREEIFGPVVAIATFKTTEEAIEIANDSDYGLAGGVYTTDIDTGIIVSNSLEAGTIWVNCYDVFDQSTPFGGYKQSGFGKELGLDSLKEYSHIKSVKIQLVSRL
ncbi:aldehyde dehydrogenase domain-containing protein [Absidia repens]|uniref:Aldehyde dehydrogenase domain-containing protein n=1 Tax=Absidia repens TaxID=90262 RepID=A0A1X2IP59_9FUNG|nr:aldehyde dehydrogenase domain-containing protein [Absidia repens]